MQVRLKERTATRGFCFYIAILKDDVLGRLLVPIILHHLNTELPVIAGVFTVTRCIFHPAGELGTPYKEVVLEFNPDDVITIVQIPEIDAIYHLDRGTEDQLGNIFPTLMPFGTLDRTDHKLLQALLNKYVVMGGLLP